MKITIHEGHGGRLFANKHQEYTGVIRARVTRGGYSITQLNERGRETTHHATTLEPFELFITTREEEDNGQ